MSDLILFSASENIGLLQLNRPEVLNALNRELYAALQARLQHAAEDEDLQVLVVAGSGRSFCAGTDINELEGIAPEEARDLARLENQVFNQLEDFPRPTLAAIHGHALGGGCELALACDLRLAAEDACFGQPEIDMGWLPAAGATFRLPDLIGRARAREMIFTGRRIDALEAERIGLVQRLVPADELIQEAMELARVLSAKDPVVLARAVEALATARSREEAVELEADILSVCAPSSRAQERIRAFLGRKKEL